MNKLENTTNQSLESLVNKPYLYGFSTEIETEKIPFGLTEKTIHLISQKKQEPNFLLNFRLRAYSKWVKLTTPIWAKLVYPSIDYQKITYYSAPKTKTKIKSLDEIDPELLLTFEKLGISLNEQKRRLFDDFTERMVSSDINERPVYLFLSGNAGTGKSFLVNVLIDAVKHIKIKAGNDLQKPPVIVMAPTANAAYIIGGRTIDSVLGFNPTIQWMLIITHKLMQED